MIKHVDLEQLPGSDEVAGHPNISFGRSRVAARMIVDKHNGRRIGGNRRLENLAGMHQKSIQVPLCEIFSIRISRRRVFRRQEAE